MSKRTKIIAVMIVIATGYSALVTMSALPWLYLSSLFPETETVPLHEAAELVTLSVEEDLATFTFKKTVAVTGRECGVHISVLYPLSLVSGAICIPLNAIKSCAHGHDGETDSVLLNLRELVFTIRVSDGALLRRWCSKHKLI